MQNLNKDARDTIIGGLVVCALAAALWSNASDRKVSAASGGYPLRAVFERSEGLATGAEVRVAGMPVGHVVSQTLDERYRAHVTLRLADTVSLPTDSAAVIETDGLLGAKYVELQPGGAEDMLPAGARIEYTQGALVLEELLEKIIGMAKARRAASAPDGGNPPADDNPAERSPFAPPPLVPDDDSSPDALSPEQEQTQQNMLDDSTPSLVSSHK